LALAGSRNSRTRWTKTRVGFDTAAEAEIDSTLLIAGCDPAGAMLADWLARRRSPVTAVALRCSSAKALKMLARGGVHVAGIHLRDPNSGEYNLKSVHNAVGRRAAVVNFARWELGLAVASGNPLHIRDFADLQRPRVGIVTNLFPHRRDTHSHQGN
jgi:molybdate-binding protein